MYSYGRWGEERTFNDSVQLRMYSQAQVKDVKREWLSTGIV